MIPAYDPDIARKTPDGKRMLTHALALVNDIAAPMCDPAANLGARCSTDWRRVDCPRCRTAGERAPTGPDEYNEYLVGGPKNGEVLYTKGFARDTVKLPHVSPITATAYLSYGATIEVTELTHERRTVGLLGHGLTVWVERGTPDDVALRQLGDILFAPHRRPAPKGPAR